MKNWLVPFIFKFLGRLPLQVNRALGSLMGLSLWYSDSRAARITQENLRLCLPALSEAERRRLARKSLKETGKTAAEAGAIWCRSPKWLQRRIRATEGEELLHKKLARGKGLLVLAPHLGNWEVVAPYLSGFGPLTALYQPPKLPALDKLILQGRTKENINMAPTNRRGVTQLLKALKRGEIVGILPDQVPDPGSGAEVAPFFGQPALTMTLVHSLIQRTGCEVVSVFAQRVRGGFRLVTINVDPSIYSPDPKDSVAGLNASVEACVKCAPAQYQWEYKRFRRLPSEYQAVERQG